MKTNKQYPDFLHLGKKLLKWYDTYSRDLPFRKTKSPYHIWICEIIFQQTRIEQGLNHYNQFIMRFPDVETLANADADEVMLYWKGLGYYSRALNLHQAAKQIMQDFSGNFPKDFNDILKLKGVGKYTAAAISSICYNHPIPAVDGNFYRVLSRVFADNFDVSNNKAYFYFSELAYQLMPENRAGDFNQAMMDLGSEVCKPKNPKCEICPFNNDCIAFSIDKIQNFPVKNKKTIITDLKLKYFFVTFHNEFLIRRRNRDFIWKNLYEFPTEIPPNFEHLTVHSQTLKHKLTHKNLEIEICAIEMKSEQDFRNFAENNGFLMTNFHNSHQKSFPKPLEQYLLSHFSK